MNKTPLFLFMDESEYPPLDIAALTGILIPIEKYPEIRDEIAQLIIEIMSPPPNTVPQPIELHGSDLLPHLPKNPESDLLRKKVFHRCVEIINNHKISIFRVCYTNYKEIISYINDEKLYGLNFSAMQSVLQPAFQDRIMIPVMDGVPNIPVKPGSPNINRRLIENFSRQIHFNHHCYQFENLRSSMSISNLQNITDTLFSSSQFNSLLQLADLTSYLLLKIDQNELGQKSIMNQYQNSIFEISKKIDPELIFSYREKLQYMQS